MEALLMKTEARLPVNLWQRLTDLGEAIPLASFLSGTLYTGREGSHEHGLHGLSAWPCRMIFDHPCRRWAMLRCNRNGCAKVSRRWLCSAEHELLRADSQPALFQSCRRRLGESLPSHLVPAFS